MYQTEISWNVGRRIALCRDEGVFGFHKASQIPGVWISICTCPSKLCLHGNISLLCNGGMIGSHTLLSKYVLILLLLQCSCPKCLSRHAIESFAGLLCGQNGLLLHTTVAYSVHIVLGFKLPGLHIFRGKKEVLSSWSLIINIRTTPLLLSRQGTAIHLGSCFDRRPLLFRPHPLTHPPSHGTQQLGPYGGLDRDNEVLEWWLSRDHRGLLLCGGGWLWSLGACSLLCELLLGSYFTRGNAVLTQIFCIHEVLWPLCCDFCLLYSWRRETGGCPSFFGAHCIIIPCWESSGKGAMKPSPSLLVGHILFFLFLLLRFLDVLWCFKKLECCTYGRKRVLVRIVMCLVYTWHF